MALVLLLAMGGRVAAEETTMSYTEALERTDCLLYTSDAADE